MTDLNTLAAAWLRAKQSEKDAQEARRAIEDKMLSLIGIPETLEGTENAETPDGYKIKVIGRITRKVDGDLAQEIAAEHGLQQHLSSLFRWTPSLDKKAWEKASADITGPLSAAITSTPARPTFAITLEKE